MIEYLDILNGSLSLEFDPLNNIYTVFINEDVDKLELKYFICDTCIVKELGNENLISGENIVVLEVSDEIGAIEYYTLQVYKEESTLVFSESVEEITNLPAPVSVAVPGYVTTGLLVVILFFIYIFYKILFKKKKRINSLH